MYVLTPFDVTYKGSIVDENLLVVSEDGSSYRRSDISILKSMNTSSSPALAEALSSRMQMRKSSGVTGMKDGEIIASMKPRYTQDKTELAAYNELVLADLRHQLKDVDNEAERQAIQQQIDDLSSSSPSETSSVEPEKTE